VPRASRECGFPACPPTPTSRCEHAGREAAGLEHRSDEIGGGRLAIGARDAHDTQLMAGVRLDPRGRSRQRRPFGSHQELGNARCRDASSQHQCRSPRRDRRGHMVVPVMVRPGECHEHVARADPARIVRHAADHDGPQVDSRPGHRAQQVPCLETLHQPRKRTRGHRGAPGTTRNARRRAPPTRCASSPRGRTRTQDQPPGRVRAPTVLRTTLCAYRPCWLVGRWGSRGPAGRHLQLHRRRAPA